MRIIQILVIEIYKVATDISVKHLKVFNFCGETDHESRRKIISRGPLVNHYFTIFKGDLLKN